MKYVRIWEFIALLFVWMNFPVQAETNGQLISYFQKNSSGYTWAVYSPTEKRQITRFDLPSLPQAYHFDASFQSVEMVLQDKIITMSLSGGDITDTVASLPNQDQVIGLWRDEETLALKIATFTLFPNEAVIKNHNQTFMPDSEAGMILALEMPEWGTHALIKTYSYDASQKKWASEHVFPTKTEAGDTPGISVLKPVWQEAGVSDLKLFSQKYCAAYGDLFYGRECFEREDQLELRQKILTRSFPQCSLYTDGYIKEVGCPISAIKKLGCENCKYSFIHVTLRGDSLHAAAPFYLEAQESKKLSLFSDLEIPDQEQLLVAHKENFILIETDEKIMLLDLNSGEIVFNEYGQDGLFLTQ